MDNEGVSLRNRAGLVAERAFGSLAHALLSPEIVVAALILRLGGGEMTVAALNSLLVAVGVAQLFTGWYLGRTGSRRLYVLKVSGSSLLLVPVLALVVWRGSRGWPTATLVVLMVVVLGRWAAGALCNPALLDLARLLLSPAERAFVFALRGFASAACGLLAAGAIHLLVRAVAYPANYACIVLASGVAGALGLASVAILQERLAGSDGSGRMGVADYARLLAELLRPGAGGETGQRFRRYVAVRHAIFLSRCAFPFLTVYALRRLGASGREIGLFTMALWGGRLVCGLVLSVVPFLRATPHRMTRLGLACTIVGLVVAVGAGSWRWLLATFFLQGAFLEAFLVADPIFLIDHAPAGHEMAGMSLTMVALYPMRLVLPLVAGALLRWVGFGALVGLALAGCVAALVSLGTLAPATDRLARPPGGEEP